MNNRIYLRVSTEDSQEFSRQTYILEKEGYKLDECIIYQEKVSGKSTKSRKELAKLLSETQKGDVVIVTEISRLARSTIDLWNIANEILGLGASLICIKENFDLSTAMGRFTFNIFGSIAQLERDTISERTKDGLAAKKKNGVVLGRPATIDKSNYDLAVEEYMNSRKSLNEIGEKYGMSGVSVYNELKKRGLKRLKKGELK